MTHVVWRRNLCKLKQLPKGPRAHSQHSLGWLFKACPWSDPMTLSLRRRWSSVSQTDTGWRLSCKCCQMNIKGGGGFLWHMDRCIQGKRLCNSFVFQKYWFCFNYFPFCFEANPVYHPGPSASGSFGFKLHKSEMTGRQDGWMEQRKGF